MTPGLLKSSNTCNKLYKKAMGKDPTDVTYIRYKEFRNNYNHLKRYARKKYYIDQINTYRTDSSKLWKIMKEVIGKRNDKSLLSDTF